VFGSKAFSKYSKNTTVSKNTLVLNILMCSVKTKKTVVLILQYGQNCSIFSVFEKKVRPVFFFFKLRNNRKKNPLHSYGHTLEGAQLCFSSKQEIACYCIVDLSFSRETGLAQLPSNTLQH
jgi:hypothetical protein